MLLLIRISVQIYRQMLVTCFSMDRLLECVTPRLSACREKQQQQQQQQSINVRYKNRGWMRIWMSSV